jgi:hypothetical protein
MFRLYELVDAQLSGQLTGRGHWRVNCACDTRVNKEGSCSTTGDAVGTNAHVV